MSIQRCEQVHVEQDIIGSIGAVKIRVQPDQARGKSSVTLATRAGGIIEVVKGSIRQVPSENVHGCRADSLLDGGQLCHLALMLHTLLGYSAKILRRSAGADVFNNPVNEHIALHYPARP